MKNLIESNKFKIFSIKDILTTKAYFSSIINIISKEFIKESPYNIIQSIENNNSNNNSNNNIILFHNIDNIIILLLIGIICINIKNNENNNNIKRLDNFIEYYKIKKKINILISIFIFIFIKNINNVY